MIYTHSYDTHPTTRSYLSQWFDQDILVICDYDLPDPDLREKLEQRPKITRILDLTHNPVPDRPLPITVDLVLTGNHGFFSNPRPGYVFFPLVLWMWSLRSNIMYPPLSFDAGFRKTHGAMCFNRNLPWHRIELHSLLEPVRHLIFYTLGETENLHSAETFPGIVGVGDPAYSTYALNIVTETSIEIPFSSEKTAKPFAARQIPLIVGGVGSNRVLSDMGLDMFDDIIPWRRWDHVEDHHLRLSMIADFLNSWLPVTDLVKLYQSVRNRIDKNKQYFHSDDFRKKLTFQIDQCSTVYSSLD